MKQLAEEYRKSMAVLNTRIHELDRVRRELMEELADPGKDPAVIELNERLKPLRAIYIELVQVTREIDHYYDRWWWRSEEYTLNQRKSGRYVYCGLIYDKAGD